MWLGEMYWNPARPPRDAVSIEILQKMGKMLESVDNFERRCPSEFFLLPLSILKVLQDNFFFSVGDDVDVVGDRDCYAIWDQFDKGSKTVQNSFYLICSF